MNLSFEHGSQLFSFELSLSDNSYRFTIDGKTVEAEILQAKEGKLEFLLNGKRVIACVSSDNARRWVTVDGQTLVLTKSPGARKGGHGAHHAAGELTAPMPGQVRAVNVAEGDTITKGQTLLILEAMKMEIRIHAPHNGVVKKLFVNQGQTVEREQALIDVEEN